MMDPIDVPFRTDYPNNAYAQRVGNGANEVFDPAVSGDGYIRTAPSEEFDVYNDYAEACRQWGRDQKAALGLVVQF